MTHNPVVAEVYSAIHAVGSGMTLRIETPVWVGATLADRQQNAGPR